LFTQLARYLAVSGRTLTAHDLYVLDLLTHIVQEDTPEDTLAMALAQTVSDE
jgi:enoyl-CoA hydratase/carnithine racemase